MKQFIYDVIKKASGNLLTIGIDDKKLFGAIKNNANINVYTIDKIDQTSIFRRNKRKSSTGKDVNLKKLQVFSNKLLRKDYFKGYEIDLSKAEENMKQFYPNAEYGGWIF